jgi:hypothetical protein
VNTKAAKKTAEGGGKVDSTLEQTVKRIERLNRILTVAVVIEAIVLVFFL